MRRSLLLLGLSFTVLKGCGASPPVEVSLRSSWPASSPFIEALETIALENPDAFFPLLNKITDPETLPSPENLTPEAAYQAILEVAVENGYLKEPGSLAAVKLNLALHAATPKIEAFYNHYIDHYNATNGDSCGSWVEWYGEVVCDIETLVRLAGVETIEPVAKESTHEPRLLTFDHIRPSPARSLKHPPRTAIFYASPLSSNFRELHDYLLTYSGKPNPHIEYVLRYVAPQQLDQRARNYLSGYGVSLDLKKTDYLAIDDRHSRNGGNGGKTSKAEDSVEVVDPVLTLIRNHPENATAPSAKTPLTEEELQKIGFQAVQLIADSSEPLSTLKQLSQNFPKYATTLARRVVVNSSLAAELEVNGMKAHAGGHALWLNGANVPDKDVNPFGLLRLLKRERAGMLGLTSLGLTRGEAFQLLTHPAAQAGSDILDGLFDATDRPEGGDVIVYWNDLEKDSRYQQWSDSVLSLIRPVYHGIPSIKYNVFNNILVLDLSQTHSLSFISGNMAMLINRQLPLRFGLVPICETEDSTRMAQLFYHLVANYGRKKTLTFITQLAIAHSATEDPTVDWDTVGRLFAEFADIEGPETANLEDILTGKASPPAPLDKVALYTERLGATLSASRTGHFFFNGKHFNYEDDQTFLMDMQKELGRQLQYLSEQIYSGRLTDAHNETLGTYFYDQPTTGLRRNRYIYPSDGPGSLRVFNLPDLFSRTGFHVEPSSFVYPAETAAIPLSLYVIADLDSPQGLELVKQALLSIGPHTRTRISFIHNPKDDPIEGVVRPSSLFAYALHDHLMSKTAPETLLRALGVEGSGSEAQTVLSQDEIVQKLKGGAKVAANSDYYAEYVKTSRLVARDTGLQPGQRALLVNGRVVGPIEEDGFGSLDFAALEKYEILKRSQPIMTALQTIVPDAGQNDRATYANLISMASSVVTSIQLPDPSEFSLFQAPPRPRNRQYQLLDSQYTAFEAGDNSTALYHVAVVMDPLTVWLANVPDTYIVIHLNPAPHNEENGQETPAQAIFEDLPSEPLYTLAMEVPPSWIVRPREALYDLDNIQLGNLLPGDNSLKAVFDLDYLVVAGHAREVVNNSPPRGLQLELLRGGEEALAIDDTQVVVNLGYFQFKAKPGVFGMEIRKGRGREVFEMESVGNEGWDSPTVQESGNEITVTSFEGLTLYPRFTRKPNMEMGDVLAQPIPETGFSSIIGDLTSRVTSLFKPKDNAPRPQEQADINIFTVASGLLYERFASIMILSVLRNTKSTVKFWFIENFLSPSFLEFIPHFAEKYNFQYELVTYKWPSWLREQTEKQRIIWAYKILFLDVLFPMDLKKVIFVDADQIVRADLKELVDLDLHGAPYGYTPMGDDNPDMEGFRFWKTGYWKEFLQGRPYHISALYVIDLVRFRQLAAGDILRGQYQQLSADPNSLANLDQGSKDRLHRAKTIDLCQNPLTKEPKLDRARQIPEWDEYDREIAQFTRQLAEAGAIHSGLATADTNVLANAGSSKPKPDAAKMPDHDSESSVHERDEL
ncbi:hypothetical protein H0H92_011214 [Tricholoma furcatifolium]|nr:hypothetical protein H0H92_011214 [Tricholoma furcatifolium]